MPVFLDSGVLINAVRGKPDMREIALTILGQPAVDFWYSPLLQLEVTLQPTYEKRQPELDFHLEYFQNANCFGDLNRIYEIGAPEAKKHGISVIDALHIAAANLSKCHYLITTENARKPMFRTKLVTVVGLGSSHRDIFPMKNPDY